MNIVRRIVIVFAAVTLSLWLYMAVSAFSLAYTLGSPSYLKSLLVGADVYDHVVDDALKLAATQNNNGTTIPNEQIAELTPVIQKTLTPGFLQTTTEALITGTFHWLDGSAKEPDFNIEVAPIRASLASNITDYLYNRTVNLPVCPRNAIPDDDPFNATCRPPGQVSKQDFSPKVGEFIADLPLLKYDTITYQNLTKDDTSTDKKELPSQVPVAYHWFKLSPYIFIFLSVLSALLIILLQRDSLKAWKTVGHTFLFTGILLVVTSVFSLVVLANSSAPINSGNEQQKAFIFDILTPLTKSFGTKISNYTLYFGVAYLAIGAACYFVGLRIKRARHLDTPEKKPKADDVSKIKEPKEDELIKTDTKTEEKLETKEPETKNKK